MSLLRSINPATGEEIQRIDEMNADEVAAIIDAADEAFSKWRRELIVDRAELLRRAAADLLQRKEKLAALMAREMGKPVTQGKGEIEKCALVCEYYAKNGAGFLEPEVIETDELRSSVHFEPLGVILAVMPWNFPFWQVFRFAAPTLLAGNAVVDRKSTRLNSSHVAISYAVFCLK